MTRYEYHDANPTCANAYLWPTIKTIIAKHDWPDCRAFDLGCGNAATSDLLSQLGFDVVGVDTSESGIAYARKTYPHVITHLGSAYDDLAKQYGKFPLVVSLEVIEHCINPQAFAKTFLDLLAPNAIGIISTPYHSYIKNLAMAVTGKMDSHFTALWVGGHIKFFSIATLRELLLEQGAKRVRFLRAGRIPMLAKSMVAIITNTD